MPCPPPGNLPNPGIEPRSPTLQADSLPSEPSGKPKNTGVGSLSLLQGNLLTQELNRGLLHCRWIPYKLNYQGSPLLHTSYIPKGKPTTHMKGPSRKQGPKTALCEEVLHKGDFPGGSDGKESTCNAGDLGSIRGFDGLQSKGQTRLSD